MADPIATDENKLLRERNRGHVADRWLADPFVNEAFETMESELTQMWRESSFYDKEGRQEAYQMLFAMRAFKAKFLSAIQTGKFAAEQLSLFEKTRRAATQGVRAVFGP